VRSTLVPTALNVGGAATSQILLRQQDVIMGYDQVTYRRNKKRIVAIKDVPCMDCGNRFPTCVMDFDHRPDEVKEFRISGGLTLRWDRVLTEINKCDIVCANCHRIRTYITRGCS